MALNATTRKKLAAMLDASSRSKLTDSQVEEAALALLNEEKSIVELAESYEVSVQTLKKRLRRAAEGPQPVAAE